ncbi:hypothetical protein TNCV_2251201 [Trichonephila clavipes]|nr:hypothetical protein TNCV_2251201 [Trichonephila clavipes]
MPIFFRPNVCTEEKNETMGEDESRELPLNNVRYCQGTDTWMTCETRFLENGKDMKKVVTYRCCPGFVQPDDRIPGCIAEKSRKHLILRCL